MHQNIQIYIYISYVFRPHYRPVLGHVVIVGVRDDDGQQEGLLVRVVPYVILVHYLGRQKLHSYHKYHEAVITKLLPVTTKHGI